MLESLLRQHVDQANIEVEVSSAGVAAGTGQAASEHAQTCMLNRQLSLESHASTAVSELTLGDYDWFLCMSTNHAMALYDAGVAEDALFVVNGDNGGVPDPYGGSLPDYEACAEVLNQAAEEIVASLLKAIKEES